MLRRLCGALCALLLLGVLAPAGAGEKGFLGLSLEVELEGTLASPLLREAKVVKVLSASPAANAGIQRGDRIVEVEGRAVAGANAYELQKLMQREVGEPLRMRLARGSAEPFDVTLIPGVARPQ
jgi:C-terminal processing protease CtpA/Prc